MGGGVVVVVVVVVVLFVCLFFVTCFSCYNSKLRSRGRENKWIQRFVDAHLNVVQIFTNGTKQQINE